MMMLLLLQQERMESHLGLREQLIDLLSLFETHLEREAMQRAAFRLLLFNGGSNSHADCNNFSSKHFHTRTLGSHQHL
ncbi:hypothetical protein GHT06_014043 [Daphnia sinensis]|uniref:Uncharacterized protein n=1 Tax=Daphnia sinensis TaxID=1820382 RepID=A0AAD5LD45_9CRUS|nr:hypothetical protein GHT06_014043 [Daphnia sinensis]